MHNNYKDKRAKPGRINKKNRPWGRYKKMNFYDSVCVTR